MTTKHRSTKKSREFDVAEYVANDERRTVAGVSAHETIQDFYLACTSRALDDREISFQKQNRAWFQIAGAGHEALLLALARSLRPGYDWFFPYYRDQSLLLGLGVTPYEVLLGSVGAADDPSSGGRQMPSHWGHKATNVVSQSSPTGSQCLPAVGCAEAGMYGVAHPNLPGVTAHADELTYISIGDGAVSEGEFWEALNSACVLKLPVVFVVEDNGYAVSVPQSVQMSGPISQMASGFVGLRTIRVDGTNYAAVRQACAGLVDDTRNGAGPLLIHADVVRPYSHSAQDTQSKYRTTEELERDALRDPLLVFRRLILASGVCTTEELDDIAAEAKATVAEAGKRALTAKRGAPESVHEHLVQDTHIPVPAEPQAATSGDTKLLIGETINRTLRDLMASDERIRVFGEDVGDADPAKIDVVDGKGGVFGTTIGLQREFGNDRCFNAPLAEATIVGRAVGQAVRGLKPSPEIQFFDYIWPAMTQIRSEAATMRWRSNGNFTCPMVIRVPIGGYVSGGAIWHSQSGESIFAHIQGLRIAFPSRARDVAGLLRAAFKYNDPVLFFEHKHLLRQPYAADPYPRVDFVLPFGVGATARKGSDLTIVTWGAMVQKCLDAAAQIAEARGLEIEVIDLRTIAPWDHEIIANSVRRTSRLLVAHEDTLTAGFGAEIAAWAANELFADLDAPVARLGALDTYVSYVPEQEAVVLPSVDKIVAAALDTLAF